MQPIVVTNLVCVIFLLIQLLAVVNKRSHIACSSIVLSVGIITTIICCAGDAACYLLSGKGLPDFLLLTIWVMTYALGAVVLQFFVCYCYYFLKERTAINKWFFYVPVIILILDGLYLIYFGYTGGIVTVTDGVAKINKGMPLCCSVVEMLVIFYLPVIAATQRKIIGKRSVCLIAIFGIIPVLASFSTIVTKGTDYTYPAGAIAVTIIHVLFETKLAYEKERNVNQQLQERFNIIQSMNSLYFASYYIDLVNDTYIELNSMEGIRKTIKANGKAQENLNLACEKLILPEFTETMKEFFDLSTIQKRLRVKNVVSCRYIGVSSGWSLAYLIAGDRDKNGNLNHIFYACRTIHDEVKKEQENNKKINEYSEILNKAGLGVWNIILEDGKEPRLIASDKMKELLAVGSQKLSEEQLYSWWFEHIVPEAIPSVNKSVAEMLDNKFSENTYLWHHPQNGNIYVRCGGFCTKGENGETVLSGYHSDVTHIVMEEALQRRTQELEENQKNMNRMNVFLLGALGTVVEFRSLESGDHVKRVMRFTKLILETVMEQFPKYNLNSRQIELISQASALHDVGKIAISDEILKAPRRLTPEEFDQMKKHTLFGCEILEKFKYAENEFYKYCYEICRWHHEKIDGKGYPDGLAGDDIPIYCQVTAIADCFDALVSQRVYKNAMTCDQAVEMLKNGECGAFSEDVLKCFELSKKELFALVNEEQKLIQS